MCMVSMHAQHELLHVDVRHLWLTRQENRGKRSQNHDAKLTRPFLRVGRGWLARLPFEIFMRAGGDYSMSLIFEGVVSWNHPKN